ncbi:MAG: hypothetical protein K0Q68_154 [Moraxellaceae bacterium]|jgi:hypothetical protein|nr:hypothetical protein [Moraxellaceae bacterium]
MLKKIIGIISMAWIGYIGFAYFSAYSSAKSFTEHLSGDCPQLNIHVIPPALNYTTISRREYVELIAWHDKKTGKEIFITDQDYRQYQATQNCLKQRFMALIKDESAKAGIIQPELRIKFGYMFAIMLLPPAVLFLFIVLPAGVMARRKQRG